MKTDYIIDNVIDRKLLEDILITIPKMTQEMS